MISVFALEMKRGKIRRRQLEQFDQWKNSDTASSESSRDHLVDPAGLLCCTQVE